MNPKFWRIQQYDAVGVSVKTIGMTAPIQSFNSLRLRGDGSCEEGSFTALVSALDINPRDILVIEASEDNSSWTPIYSGIVTAPGAKRSPDVSEVRLVGLSKRIGEVAVDEQTYIEQDLGETVREIVDEFLPDGVIYDAALVPDVNFTIGEVNTQFQLLDNVLNNLALGAPQFVVPAGESYTYDGVTYDEFETVPAMTWGVLPNRKFFFKRVAGSETFTEAVDDVQLDYDVPSAEDICTKVVFYAIDGVTFQDGIVVRNEPLITDYGEVTKVFSIAAGSVLAETITSITRSGFVSARTITPEVDVFERTTNAGFGWTFIANANAVNLESDLAPYISYLTDNDTNTRLRRRGQWQLDPNDWFFSTSGYGFRIDIANPKLIESVFIKGTITTTNLSPSARIRLFDSNTFLTTTVGDFPVPLDGSYSVAAEGNQLFIGQPGLINQFPGGGALTVEIITELEQVELLSRPVLVGALDRIAESLFKAPVFERVDVRKPGVTLPIPVATVNFAAGGGVTLDVADVEYRITPELGFETVLNLGQGVNAELIAQAALIERRANKAEFSVFDVITRVP
jgi:hypothetical protein